MSTPSPMKSRRLKLSEEVPQTISRRCSPPLDDADEESLWKDLPTELTTDIFSRLPLESIARCRCVSKQWASMLCHPDFTNLFFAKSLARRPQLLLAFQRNRRRLVFFSSPQPRENASLIAADHHLSFARVDINYQSSSCLISSIVNGLFCVSHSRLYNRRSGAREPVLVICNPSTRQSFTLPKMKTRMRSGLRSFFAYDPIEKQHKVLAMVDKQGGRCEEHQVITLGGAGNLTWRMVECEIPHSFPRADCVCIDGVLYYIAVSNSVEMLFCFDVRSEKYSFVKHPERNFLSARLINFHGKLASVRYQRYQFRSNTSRSFQMRILEDPEKHEWSKRSFNVPPMCKDAAEGDSVHFVGVTATNEFVFSLYFPSYLYYYNFVSQEISRVEIQGIGAFEKNTEAHVILNHFEDAKTMELF